MAHGRAGGRSGARDASPPSKVCASCGRRFEWRAKWARSWGEVRYCSDACRRRGVTADDRAVEEEIVAALGRRPGGAVLDLDEVAASRRAPDGVGDGAACREQVRRAARRLADRGAVEWLQRGTTVDPSTARGPVGIRLL